MAVDGEQEAGSPREVCAACGFDSELYDRADTISSQLIVPAVVAAAVEGLAAEALGTRVASDVWSIAEYIDHVGQVVRANASAIGAAVANPGIDFGAPPELGASGGARVTDVAAALDGVSRGFEAMHELLGGLGDDDWNAAAVLAGERLDVGWFARHVLHDGLHHFADIGRIRHRLGLGSPGATGVVTGVHVSGGGVPKRAVDGAAVGPGGIDGDAQNDRRHHGRPVQALCLWSADVIAALQAEGHPISPGSAGENVTIGGVEWAGLRPGARLDVGSVPLLVSAHAIPCAKNAQWFADRDFTRIRHERHPGWSRLYALPLGSGRVAVGDPVVVEP